MVKLTCPNCAADLEVATTAPIHTCEYCGTAINVAAIFGAGSGGAAAAGGQVSTERVIKDHYLIRCHYDQQAAKDLLVDWVKKVPGAPQDFEDVVNINIMKLTFFPIWVGEYGAESDYVGIDDWPNFSKPAGDKPGWYEVVSYYKKEERGHVSREYQIPLMAIASEKLPPSLRDYLVTTTGKEYFDINHVKKLGGEILDSAFNFDDAKKNMQQQVLDRQSGEFHKEVTQITSRSDNVEERGVFYIHFPVWQMQFLYGKKTYDALIDGSSGRIINVKVPMSTQFRAKTISAGAAFVVVGLAFLLLGAFVLTDLLMIFGLTGGIGLIIVGIMFFGLNMRKQASEKQT